MLNKIKSVLKYYSDMLTSINYHNKKASEKMSKLIQLEEYKKQLQNHEKEITYYKNDFEKFINKPQINIAIEVALVDKISIKEDNNINISYITEFSNMENYDFVITSLNTDVTQMKNFKLSSSDFRGSTFILLDKYNFESKTLKAIEDISHENGIYILEKKFLAKCFFDIDKIQTLKKELINIVPINLINDKITKNYFFSIIIPVYNVENFVDETVNSILNQKNYNTNDLDIILIDDCSTDNSYKVIQKYEIFKNIRVFKNEENLGLGLTRNRGIELANNEYILFVDSDDNIEPNLFSKVNGVLNKYGKIDVIYHRILLWKENEKISIHKNKEKFNNTFLKKENYELVIDDTSSCSKIFNKKIFANKKFTKGFYEDIWLTSYLYESQIFLLDYDGYLYRKQNQPSITNTHNYNCIAKLKHISKIITSIDIEISEKKIDTINSQKMMKKMLERFEVVFNQYLNFTKLSLEEGITYNFEKLKEIIIICKKYELISQKLYFLEFLDNCEELEEFFGKLKRKEIIFNENNFFIELTSVKKIKVEFEETLLTRVRYGRVYKIGLNCNLEYFIPNAKFERLNNKKYYDISLMEKNLSMYIKNSEGYYERKNFNF